MGEHDESTRDDAARRRHGRPQRARDGRDRFTNLSRWFAQLKTHYIHNLRISRRKNRRTQANEAPAPRLPSRSLHTRSRAACALTTLCTAHAHFAPLRNALPAALPQSIALAPRAVPSCRQHLPRARGGAVRTPRSVVSRNSTCARCALCPGS